MNDRLQEWQRRRWWKITVGGYGSFTFWGLREQSWIPLFELNRFNVGPADSVCVTVPHGEILLSLTSPPSETKFFPVGGRNHAE
jgi:hypothetical protein